MKHLSWAPLGALALAISAIAGGAHAADEKSVAVTAIVEYPALDAVRDGVQAALKEAGYEAGKNLKWQYQSAQGNTGTAAQIARKFVGDKPDAIVAIATPSAQAVVASTKTVPVVFSAVTDPVAAKLVPSWEPSKNNVTGVSDLLALDKQMDLVKQVVPNAKRVGMVYNPGEANSAVVVKELKALLPKLGMTLVEAAAPRSVDVSSAARSLVGKVDVIYTNTDNNVVSAYESLVKVGQDAKIPLVASDTDSVKRGAVAALGINYRDLGEQTGRMVVRILKGEKPGDMATWPCPFCKSFSVPRACRSSYVSFLIARCRRDRPDLQPGGAGRLHLVQIAALSRPHGGRQLSAGRRRLRHPDFHGHQSLAGHAGRHGRGRRRRPDHGLAQCAPEDHGSAGLHPDDDRPVFGQPAHHGRPQRAADQRDHAVHPAAARQRG